MSDTCYATTGLVDYLLEYAHEREPNAVSVPLSVTPAENLDVANLPPDTRVFTHFYMPEAGSSVNAVFGVDLGTPVGQTKGRFVSHPDGSLDVSKRDDLHTVVFVAVPPWDRDSVRAFDRSGRQQDLQLLDVEPPEEVL